MLFWPSTSLFRRLEIRYVPIAGMLAVPPPRLPSAFSDRRTADICGKHLQCQEPGRGAAREKAAVQYLPSHEKAERGGSRALKADLSGHWSVSVNGNWRRTFAFENGDAILVDYQDYQRVMPG